MRCRTETFAVVRDFTFLAGTSNGSYSFFTVFLYKFFIFPNLVEFFKYQKYGECSDYYRLFCFRQILFLMHSLLVLMKLSIYISGLRHEKLYYSRQNAETKYELVCNST